MAQFSLRIHTPDKDVFHGEVEGLLFHSETGQAMFLAHHADYLGSMSYTRIKITRGDTTDEYIGRRGIARFNNATNSAELLLLDCTPVEEVSAVTAASYLAMIEEALAKGTDLSHSQLKFMKEEKIMLVKQLKDLEE